MLNTGKNITIAKYVSGTIQFTNSLKTFMTMVQKGVIITMGIVS